MPSTRIFLLRLSFLASIFFQKTVYGKAPHLYRENGFDFKYNDDSLS